MITIKYIPTPMVIEYNLMGTLKTFIADLKEKKTAIAEVRFNTKTSFKITLQSGTNRYGIDQEVAGLKYHAKQRNDFFSGGSYTGYYLKAKNMNDVQKHIEGVLTELGIELDGFVIECYENEATQKLRTA